MKKLMYAFAVAIILMLAQTGLIQYLVNQYSRVVDRLVDVVEGTTLAYRTTELITGTRKEAEKLSADKSADTYNVYFGELAKNCDVLLATARRLGLDPALLNGAVEKKAEADKEHRALEKALNAYDADGVEEHKMFLDVALTQLDEDFSRITVELRKNLAHSLELQRAGRNRPRIGGMIAAAAGAGLLLVFALAFSYQFAKPLRRTIDGFSARSTGLNHLAHQLLDSSHHSADRAHAQAGVVRESCTAADQLATHARANEATARDVRRIIEQACATAETGSRGMARLNTHMGEMKARADRIAGIIKAIDEIAFQTNLLALNAAVEAAHAGAAGAGFAVVAAEVRSLAAQATQAARETETIIAASLDTTKKSSECCAEVDKTLQQIREVVGTANGLVARIDEASREQAGQATHILQVLTRTNEATEINVQQAGESTAIGQELIQHSRDLRGAVDELIKLAQEKPAEAAEDDFTEEPAAAPDSAGAEASAPAERELAETR